VVEHLPAKGTEFKIQDCKNKTNKQKQELEEHEQTEQIQIQG
jgi:hypothetical protein